MNEFLRQIFAPNPLSAILRAAPYFLLYILTVLAPTCALLYAVYFILTLPLRRNERARLFVDLLELGLSRGRTPEAAVLEVAWGGDASLGHPFLLLSLISPARSPPRPCAPTSAAAPSTATVRHASDRRPRGKPAQDPPCLPPAPR